jgi:hypothetical protein
MLTNARTSEYLWPGQDPTMKIDHNVNRRPLEHSSAEENAQRSAYLRSGELEAVPTTGAARNLSGCECVILSTPLMQAR